MKKFLFLFLIVTLYSNIEAQETKNFFLGVNALSTTKGIFSNILVGLDLKKIKLQTGILLGSSFLEKKLSVGAQFDMLFFPIKNTENKFNFYLKSSLHFFNNKIIVNSSKVVTNTIQLTFGQGFEYRISKKIFFKTDLNIGELVEIRKFNFATTSPKLKLGFAGMFSLGLKYKL